MLSPETQAVVNSVQLCDKTKEKVCILIDINKANKRLFARDLTPDEFYEMYDYPMITLSARLQDLQYAIKVKDLETYSTMGTL